MAHLWTVNSFSWGWLINHSWVIQWLSQCESSWFYEASKGKNFLLTKFFLQFYLGDRDAKTKRSGQIYKNGWYVYKYIFNILFIIHHYRKEDTACIGHLLCICLLDNWSSSLLRCPCLIPFNSSILSQPNLIVAVTKQCIGTHHHHHPPPHKLLTANNSAISQPIELKFFLVTLQWVIAFVYIIWNCSSFL